MRRSFKLLGAAALAALVSSQPIAAGQGKAFGAKILAADASPNYQSVSLGLNKSLVIELESPAADVVITNPEIADAVVQTSKRLIFRGVAHGQTNAIVYDRAGNQILNLDISVEMDMAGLHAMIARLAPSARVKVEGLSGNVVMTGHVASIAESDQIEQLVRAYLRATDKTQIVNMMQMDGREQVLLEVRIVEMQRNVVKQLGVNLSGTPGWGDFARLVQRQIFADTDGDGIPESTGGTTLAPGLPQSFNGDIESALGYAIQGRSLGGLTTEATYQNYVGTDLQTSVGAAVNALERIGVVRTLAEPTIVAMSGESGKFLAGGEFPVPVGQDSDGSITIEFKPYGVGLGFTPVVLSEGRISLKVSTEVSELTALGSFQGELRNAIDSNGNLVQIQGLSIPALTVRRAESVVELPSGGSMMMAGLIQSRNRQNLDQVPGLKKLPVLGALFQSRDFLMEETELVVIVTPYLVDPAAKSQLRTPADGYANATDPRTIFFGKLNQQYGKDGKPVEADTYRGPVGFIEE